MSEGLLAGTAVRPSGECAVVVEFGDTIDPATHDRVLALDRAVAARPPPGVVETVPTYRSLLLHLDPLVTTPSAVLDALRTLPPAGPAPATGPVTVPVRLDGEDLGAVASSTGLTRDEVVELLLGATYRLYQYGFAPGFAYLGGVPTVLDVPRRPTPRDEVPAGSVLLAAGQLALCPTPMPTGWWVVGRTTQRTFDPGADPPVRLPVGATVVLRSAS